MKIVIVGTGYVGLISGLCFAEFGFDTLCIDKDQSRLNTIGKGLCPFFEPGLQDLLVKHLNSTKRFSLSNNLSESLKDANVVLITVGTPTKRLENEADLSAIHEVAKEISENIVNYCVVVTKSTVPVGTTRKIKDIISQKVSSNKFDIVSNPEFLREGSAINDFMRPDRVVIGTENKKSEGVMREIYRPLYLQETSIVSTTIESAEVIKYASNSFLATKISFINEVADLCETVGANVLDVAKAMGLDNRIGDKFLHAGPGFGGSCFPKDVKAFSVTAKKNDVEFSIGNGNWGGNGSISYVNMIDGNIYGCTDSGATNYDMYANIDDGSCYFEVTQEITLEPGFLNNISLNVYLEDMSPDFVFDNMKGEKEDIIIDKIKYEKIHFTITYDIQQASYTKSYVDFLSIWTLEYDLNVDGHGLVRLPIFQANVPLTLAEGDILTFQWTILREMN